MTQLRIGVTGHRRYRQPGQVRESVAAVLARLLADGASPVVITALAEGADRLVADMVLEIAGGALEVLLPLEPDQFATDFETPGSALEFDRLLAAARRIDIIDHAGATRADAYALAGRAMVERSDVLIALWDGAPARGVGGTAEIVQDALDHGVPVEVVLVERAAPP